MPSIRAGHGGFATRDDHGKVRAKMSRPEKVGENFTEPLEGAASHTYFRFRHSGVDAQFLGRFLPKLLDHLRVVFFCLDFAIS